MSDVVLIMDQYKRFEQAEQQHQKIDPAYEANKLSELANAFGSSLRRVAIVNDYDRPGFEAYKQARYEIVNTNGTRAEDVQGFIARMRDDLERRPHENLLVFTDDPTFRFLLDPIARQGDTHTKVWVLGKQVRAPFDDRKYHARLYNEIIPEPKVPKVTVLFDYENLHIGLKQRGWRPDAKALIEAARHAVSDLGDIVKMTAYADWKLLEQNDQRDWQRELAGMGIDTQYVLNERGKNTADMKIADAVRDLVERNAHAPDAVDVVVLGTNDRDFRATVEKARERGQRLVLLAIKGGLSRHLLDLLDPKEIRYIDEYLTMKPRQDNIGTPVAHPTPSDPLAGLLVNTAVWLRQHGWFFAPFEPLAATVASGEAGAEQLRRAVKAGVLTSQRKVDATGAYETIALSRKHSLAKGVQRLVEWAPKQVDYSLNTRKLPYVDTNYLCKGMTLDRQLQELGVGQQRREAEQWLTLLANAGLLIAEPREHPVTPGKTITTWRLPKAEDKNSAEAEGVPVPVQPPAPKPPVQPPVVESEQSSNWPSRVV